MRHEERESLASEEGAEYRFRARELLTAVIVENGWEWAMSGWFPKVAMKIESVAREDDFTGCDNRLRDGARRTWMRAA
jgi:hypothetical protein